MKRQRYDARQLEAAREDGSASQEGSVLIDFLASRSGDLPQRGTRRPPTARPDGAGAKKKRAPTVPGLAPQNLETRIRKIVARLATRESDSKGKTPCCFLFGSHVTGQTCDRGGRCARSHDATYWNAHVLTCAAMADAFSMDEAQLVACKRGWCRTPPDARGYNTGWRSDQRPYAEQGARERSRSHSLASDDGRSRDRVVGDSGSKHSVNGARSNNSSGTVSREASGQPNGDTRGDDRSQGRSSSRR